MSWRQRVFTTWFLETDIIPFGGVAVHREAPRVRRYRGHRPEVTFNAEISF
jgi:hypothetical protein